MTAAVKAPKLSNGGARIISKTKAVPSARRPTKGQKLATASERRKRLRELLQDGARKRAAAEKARDGR